MVWLVRAATDRNPPSLGGEDVKKGSVRLRKSAGIARHPSLGTDRAGSPCMKMRIGELARMAGCQVVTIRYYEKEGLLPRRNAVTAITASTTRLRWNACGSYATAACTA